MKCERVGGDVFPRAAVERDQYCHLRTCALRLSIVVYAKHAGAHIKGQLVAMEIHLL